MRILFLNPIGALGGAERSLLDVFAAIRALEPTWELRLIIGADGPLRGEAERLGVATETLPMPDEMLVLDASISSKKSLGSAIRSATRASRAAFGAVRYAEELSARVEELKPDIIHSNGSRFHVITRLLESRHVPVIWHLRDFVSSRKLMRRALRWAEPAATLAIANSNAVAVDARTVFKKLPVRAVLNCVDTERFSPGVSHEELNEDASLRVGLVASYARWKGQDLFLKIAALIKQNAPDLSARFYIVGGPVFKSQGTQFTRSELYARAVELNVADRVELVPFQNEPERVYRSMDVVVHCSTEPEPFGRTIAEAMACGRSVVAAFDGGVRELIEPGIDAFGATPNDSADFAAKIVRLLRNSGEREALGANARRAACERFSRARLGLDMRAIYTSLATETNVGITQLVLE